MHTYFVPIHWYLPPVPCITVPCSPCPTHALLHHSPFTAADNAPHSEFSWDYWRIKATDMWKKWNKISSSLIFVFSSWMKKCTIWAIVLHWRALITRQHWGLHDLNQERWEKECVQNPIDAANEVVTKPGGQAERRAGPVREWKMRLWNVRVFPSALLRAIPSQWPF